MIARALGQAASLGILAFSSLYSFNARCEDSGSQDASFEAALQKARADKPSADLAPLCVELAEQNANSKLGRDAICAGLEMLSHGRVDLSEAFAFAERHPNELAGAKALELGLTATPEQEREDSAARYSERFRGTLCGFEADLVLLTLADSPSNLEGLEEATLRALTFSNTGNATDPRVQRILLTALDLIGRPDLASHLEGGLQDDTVWLARSRHCEQELRANAALEGFPQLLRDVFIADAWGNSQGFSAALSKVMDLLSESNLASVPPDTFGVIRAQCDGLIRGTCRRARSGHSNFAAGIPGGKAPASPLLNAAVAVLERSIAQANADKVAVVTLTHDYACLIKEANLSDSAEPYFLLVLENTTRPDERTDAAIALADVYESNWDARDSAVYVLERAVQAGAEPRAFAALARAYERIADYGSMLDILQSYLSVEPDALKRDHAQFLTGYALNKLGRKEESAAIWRALGASTSDAELKKATDEMLAAEQIQEGK